MEIQSIRLQDQRELMTIEQIQQSFDSIAEKIDEDKNLLSDATIIKEIIHLTVHPNEKYLCEPTIINHRIFLLLRDSYLNLLQRWRDGEQLDDTSCFIFETISNLFLKMSSYISDSSASILKEFIFHDVLLNEMNTFLEELSVNSKYLKDPQIKGIDNLLRTIQRLERTRFDHKKDYLFDNIVKCICSTSFIEIFLQSVTEETDDAGQKFFLNTCTDYIYSHSTDKQHKQSLIDIRQALLRPFTQWLNQQSSLFRSWNNRIIIILRQICFLLTLNIQLNRFINLEKDIFEYYCQMIDSFINILYSIIQSDNTSSNKLVQLLLGTLTPNLYIMTLSHQLEKYIQNKHVTSLILKLSNFENDEIQLNTFKILSSITTEQDTKNVIYSNNLTNLFIKFFEKIIDDPNQTLRFYNLLRCLKRKFRFLLSKLIEILVSDLIQYDPIKDELTKQNGLPLIIRCATETKFKPLQVQHPALEILFALTFNHEAYQQLKSNSTQIKPFLSSSNQGTAQTAEYILWKLEKEEEALAKQRLHHTNYKYDIMLSYSHLDKDLCLRIYDQLIKDDFRVWINQDETLVTTMNEKSQIIDECEYVLICISDTYKQNFFCRCEASYAFERQCQIIPLIVTANYRPDGWLNRVINGKVSIDFTKLDFELAETKLKHEFVRQRKSPKKDSIPTAIEIRTKSEYPSEINQWTNEDVKLFLVTKNLHSLVPIFSEMDGNLLYEIYQMCLSNRESMFHTLQRELSTLNANNQSLTLLIYLRFLSEIQKYIPSYVINQK